MRPGNAAATVHPGSPIFQVEKTHALDALRCEELLDNFGHRFGNDALVLPRPAIHSSTALSSDIPNGATLFFARR